MADTNDQVRELKPRGDSDDANRRLAESRSPFLRMDARLDVVPERYVPAKDERVIRDSTRSSSPEFAALLSAKTFCTFVRDASPIGLPMRWAEERPSTARGGAVVQLFLRQLALPRLRPTGFLTLPIEANWMSAE